MHLCPEGVPQNGAWAVDWLQRAADQGDVDAATWLLFSNPITDDRRKQFFSRRLKPTDRFRLTFVVQLSDGRIHRRPCSTDEKDGAQIEFSLGVMYEKGIAGFPQDDRQAAEWYRRASERNFADAQTKLAYLYAAGRGVEQSEIEAARLFRRAAEQSNALAEANLGQLDRAIARTWLGRISLRNCLSMTSVAFFEFRIYTANQREGASPPLARS